ncbi:hypothetical protein BDV29DRAFT_155476 [Aspergillus leporis]|uniref:Uncharacterized protein n=1 Tax=Aspergillus leporis TaxID=41062 RepID=A0A5N5X4T4_9EURO|nr:hypothetical protein BDV29DRAFT_155476 [Aspergillus leporis]
MTNKTRGKGKSKGKGKSRLRRGRVTSNKDCSSDETPTEADLDRFSEEITTELETAFQIEDDPGMQLSLSKTPGTDAEVTRKRGEVDINIDEGPNKIGSFRRRLLTLTGNSLRLSTVSERPSSQLHSSTRKSCPGRSDSATPTLTRTNTTGTSDSTHSPIKKKEKESSRPTPAPPTPKYLKYVRSANDYIFLDLDFLEIDSSSRKTQSGSLSQMGVASQQAATKRQSREQNFHQIKDQDPKKKNLREQIEYIRSITGTGVRTISSTDFRYPRRADDNVRQWTTVNLRCTICRGDCPVCGVACCKYEAARRTIANAEYRSEEAINLEAVADMFVRTVAADVQVRYVAIFNAE